MRSETVVSAGSRPIAEAPWTVKGYLGVTLIAAVVWVAVGWFREGTFVSTRPLAMIIPLALAVGLLKGFRAAWALATVLAAVGIFGAFGLLSQADRLVPEQWISLVTWALTTALLIHPQTRTWATR